MSMNPRTLRARRAISEATRKLVAEKPVENITLTQIAEAAGVSRPTVYNQFNDTATLVAEVTMASLDEVLEVIDHKPKAANDKEYLQSLMADFVSAVYQSRDFYRNAVYGPSAASIIIGVSEMLDARMSTHLMEKRLLVSGDIGVNDRRAAISAGIVWLLVRWLDSDFQGENTPEGIASRIAEVMYSLSGAKSA